MAEPCSRIPIFMYVCGCAMSLCEEIITGSFPASSICAHLCLQSGSREFSTTVYRDIMKPSNAIFRSLHPCHTYQDPIYRGNIVYGLASSLDRI